MNALALNKQNYLKKKERQKVDTLGNLSQIIFFLLT
jgi:hypothetical protein